MTDSKVFISYSHDSQDHKKWVLQFATRLRSSGIDAVLDQWDLKPGDDLTHFMETHLSQSDRVIMVCSARYVNKANQGVGGVGYEKMIMTADLLGCIEAKKVIPVIRQEGTNDVPVFIKTKLFLDFSRDDDFEFNYDELIRTLHNAPLFPKPKVGNNPFEHVEDVKPSPIVESIDHLIAFLASYFNDGNYNSYRESSELLSRAGESRILVTLAIYEAE
jgi:hypothetical protein